MLCHLHILVYDCSILPLFKRHSFFITVYFLGCCQSCAAYRMRTNCGRSSDNCSQTQYSDRCRDSQTQPDSIWYQSNRWCLCTFLKWWHLSEWQQAIKIVDLHKEKLVMQWKTRSSTQFSFVLPQIVPLNVKRYIYCFSGLYLSHPNVFLPLIIVKYTFAFVCVSSVTYFVSKFVLENKYKVLVPFLKI